MSTHRFFGFRNKHTPAVRAAEKKSTTGNRHSSDAKQPFSDGSEEFFEEFTRREEGLRRREHAGFLVGLGLALGLFLSVGMVVFLRYNKGTPAKRRRWLDW
jgi:hypothetical protein